MKDNILMVSTPSGGQAEIYTSQVYQAFDEFKNSLENPDEDIRKATTFTGCLKSIYKKLFAPHEKQVYNKRTILDTADIDSLNKLWDIYTELCYSCDIKPTLLRFSLLTGITQETFQSWRKEEYRNNKNEYSLSVKRWLEECENAAVDGVLQSNAIGPMFILKACYGYKESVAAPIEENIYPVHDSAAEIMARHQHATLPVKPELD